MLHMRTEGVAGFVSKETPVGTGTTVFCCELEVSRISKLNPLGMSLEPEDCGLQSGETTCEDSQASGVTDAPRIVTSTVYTMPYSRYRGYKSIRTTDGEGKLTAVIA